MSAAAAPASGIRYDLGAPIPWLGIAGVALATFVSTLNGRLSTFGLADVRGAISAGFDEGAWITTAQTVAQMLVAPLAVWWGTVYGGRRVLYWAALAFALISFLKPFSTDLFQMLTLQFAGGVASGFFVPLTMTVILKNMPPRAWAYGVSIYALNLEFSQNISASLEGWYVEHLSWKWIFWQSVPLSLAMAYCLYAGFKPEPRNTATPPTDRFALIVGGVGLSLIYAALDQGNRLDWLNSGLICGLLAAGALTLTVFLIHEKRDPHPLFNLRVVFGAPLLRVLLLICLLRLIILSTAFVVPQFLGAVRGFRALEIGDTLIWIAIPQLLVCIVAGLTLRRIDARLGAAIGFLLVCIACLMMAYSLTTEWGSEQFMLSQLLQAVGQSFAITGIVFYAVQHIRREDALTMGAAAQVTRLMGGELGSAFVSTFTRIREQRASNLIGLHLQAGSADVEHRVRIYAAATARAGNPMDAGTRGAHLLSSVVRQAATVQSVIDASMALALSCAIGLLILGLSRAAPVGPASHRWSGTAGGKS